MLWHLRGVGLMPRHTVAALRALMVKELAKGLIFEATIVGSKDLFIEGVCCENGEITVNPSVNVVDTLIHELLHRRFPRWSEDRVRLETWRIMKHMSDADIAAWYRKYKRMAKRKTKPVRLRASD